MSAISLRIQCASTALVALGAAYASYIHGRQFALRFGADTMTASIWPLIVDGLLTTATVELWKPSRDNSSRWPAWSAFVFGISLSLCANIASAPVTSAFGVAVAACPPLALLLAVELLNRALKRHRTEPADPIHTKPGLLTPTLVIPPLTPDQSDQSSRPTAEQLMWNHYQHEHAQGRTPSGAELDRVAGTHNSGRRNLRKWRSEGCLSHTALEPHRTRETPSRPQTTAPPNPRPHTDTTERELAESTS
ncbi:DUF2637 domain-containing protein [Amycolatopsis roodepoortensis]|uniref:DUF2637 domain-containing protein n=1 Tax=Amycolatopsis roodepoortensis TaxID=700274 RepID=A0ABR9LAK8_9PSEU|nr:DUF2637 domain-containing protein [Amycolatopsis roodepoortensis]MBE1577685.1 hypothetical protein [Amycolatopsis roodepoortensis]